MRTAWMKMVAGVFAISGCASVSNPQGNLDNQEVGGKVDSAHVTAINNLAKSRGVTVYWLHYPTKYGSSQ